MAVASAAVAPMVSSADSTDRAMEKTTVKATAPLSTWGLGGQGERGRGGGERGGQQSGVGDMLDHRGRSWAAWANRGLGGQGGDLGQKAVLIAIAADAAQR